MRTRSSWLTLGMAAAMVTGLVGCTPATTPPEVVEPDSEIDAQVAVDDAVACAYAYTFAGTAFRTSVGAVEESVGRLTLTELASQLPMGNSVVTVDVDNLIELVHAQAPVEELKAASDAIAQTCTELGAPFAFKLPGG